MNVMKKFAVILGVSLVLLQLNMMVGCAEQKGQRVVLRVAAGGAGGALFLTLAGFATIVSQEYPEITMKVVPGGAIANHVRVGAHEVEIASGYPSFIFAARKGEAPYDKPYPKIRPFLKGFGMTQAQFAIAQDTGINSIEEAVEKKYPLRVGVLPPGSSDEYVFKRILEYYGVTYNTIRKWGGGVYLVGYSDQVSLFKDRHINAVFQNIAVPSPSIMEAKIYRPLRVLSLSKELLDYLHEDYAFDESVIPVGTYGGEVVKQQITTTAMYQTLMAHADVPEEAIYKITKALCENVDKVYAVHHGCRIFDPKTACKDLGGPLHPGAERYYREKGYID